MAQPEVASFADFAGIARVRASYVTRLKADGRLVLTEDGKQVRVAESLQRIQATRDPGKAGVAARHAAARGAQVGEGAGGGAIAPPAPNGAPAADDPARGEAEGEQGYQHWRARNERAKALASERENAIAEGKLLAASEVEAAIASAATTLRGRMESLPATLGPQLAVITDEAQLIATLAEAIEHMLEEVARQFAVVGRGAASGEA